MAVYKRTFSNFGWDLYFKPEFTYSLYSDHLGRGRFTGYTCASSERSDRLQHANKYDSLYKSLQRILIWNNYLAKADEIIIYSIPQTSNKNKDIPIIMYKSGVFTVDPEAYKYFQSSVNGFKITDNRFVNEIVKYLQHFASTGEDVAPQLDWRQKLQKVVDPFQPKKFENKQILAAYCEQLKDAGFPLGRCQDYFIKMKEKNQI